MPDPSNMPQEFEGKPPAAALVGAVAGQPYIDDDIALGCECADPALQIERWGLEALQFLQRCA
jgi:hypothetical protein